MWAVCSLNARAASEVKTMKRPKICNHCGAVYLMNFANGSGHTHCTKAECIAAHRLEADERNRHNSKMRMQMLRRMSAGVAV